MCGISGEIRFDGTPADISVVHAISHSQRRRGPDGEGMLAFDTVALAHRRLKIFDLSRKAQQPMFDPMLGLAITFNGAIYNYQELRRELQSKGYQFFSESDTEVLLKAYNCWNLDMLYKLQGIFAFAIWERDSGRLILARDRMGVKPLYYTRTSSFFRFASTLPALLTQDMDKALDKEALQYYFSFHAVPEPLTLIKGIRKLEPGMVMIVSKEGEIKRQPYWQLRFYSEGENETLTEQEWQEQIEETLERSVRIRMTADVPVGVLLSGGLDSSLLVALIAGVTNHSPLTFSIGFESTGREKGDEFIYSDAVARHFSTEHRKIMIKTPEIAESMQECVQAMSEPIVSHDAIAFYLLSQEVSKHVTVVQSGQGADELFAGYHWFQDMNGHNIFPRLAAETLFERVADNTYQEYSHIVTPEYRADSIAVDLMENVCRQSGSSHMLDMMQQYESTYALSNGPLARVDNMTMAWGLEAREPFLDPELARIACRMPASLKLKKGGKYIIKKLAGKLLPEDIINRPKGYFPVPALSNPDIKEMGWLRDTLSPHAVKQRGVFDPHYVKTLLSRPEEYVTPLGASKLWQLGVLECWLQAHRIH